MVTEAEVKAIWHEPVDFNSSWVSLFVPEKKHFTDSGGLGEFSSKVGPHFVAPCGPAPEVWCFQGAVVRAVAAELYMFPVEYKYCEQRFSGLNITKVFRDLTKRLAATWLTSGLRNRDHIRRRPTPELAVNCVTSQGLWVTAFQLEFTMGDGAA
ncbi:hypothetical protein BDY19DRAFT_906956 [Irpex rosettiformis]|uniref:Uncharacterized protein n=1 Tax=Irpex rosettiformis TaxID=378272 RepID=A0ACB8U1B5_9APHY|nr:hypothetical protein BDY19DRAFT_906956 [Irpex rosettiformis]